MLNSGNIQASNIKINNEVNPSYKIPYSIPYEVVYDEYKGARIYVTVREYGGYYGGFINLVKYESGRGHRYTYKGSLSIVGSPFN